MTIVNFVAQLKILLFLDNNCTISIMQKSCYNGNEIMLKCQKIPSADYMIMHTGNGDIKPHFWIVILLVMQQVTIQLQLLVCDTKAKAGILVGKDAFDQLNC